MAAVVCPSCGDLDIMPLQVLDDGRKRLECQACSHVWLHGEMRVEPARRDSYSDAKRSFPQVSSVDPERKARVDALKASFLERHPVPMPEVAPFWARYQRAFSEEGLEHADPSEFHYFANVETGARPGNMSVFNNEWRRIGPDEGARRVRESVHYLLYGPDSTPIEDRLTHLLEPGTELGMKGWKESLLTKVLCIQYPDRFLPILTYTSPNGGKREMARMIWGLELPDPNRVNWTIGRLIFWANDTLIELAGDGFAHMQHVAEFVWMAKDREADLAGKAESR